MAHPTCIPVTCEACHGSGRVTVTRSRWIGGANGYRSEQTAEVRCDACLGYGERYVSEFTATTAGRSPEPPPARRIAIAGHQLHAPGFTPATFDRGVYRSFDEGLRVEATDLEGVYLASNPTHSTSYTVTRETCSCRAGRSGKACKHRARVIFELDICEGRYLPAPVATGKAVA